MTHLIIPIKDLEVRIEDMEKMLKNYEEYWSAFTSDWNRTSDYQQAQGALIVYKKLLETAKQISLNEKDIESNDAKKANMAKERFPELALDNNDKPFYSKENWSVLCIGFVEGYKQALKDLR